MKIIKERIKIFSSAKEMPIGRYSDFQKYLSMEFGFDKMKETAERLKALVQEGKYDDFYIEIDNVIAGVLRLNNGIGIYTYPFAVLVAEIGANSQISTSLTKWQPCNDTTIEGLDRTIEMLETIGITQQDVEDAVLEVKKK